MFAEMLKTDEEMALIRESQEDQRNERVVAKHKQKRESRAPAPSNPTARPGVSMKPRRDQKKESAESAGRKSEL